MDGFVFDVEMLTLNRTIDRLIDEVRQQKEAKLKEAAEKEKKRFEQLQLRQRQESVEFKTDYNYVDRRSERSKNSAINNMAGYQSNEPSVEFTVSRTRSISNSNSYSIYDSNSDNDDHKHALVAHDDDDDGFDPFIPSDDNDIVEKPVTTRNSSGTNYRTDRTIININATASRNNSGVNKELMPASFRRFKQQSQKQEEKPIITKSQTLSYDSIRNDNVSIYYNNENGNDDIMVSSHTSKSPKTHKSHKSHKSSKLSKLRDIVSPSHKSKYPNSRQSRRSNHSNESKIKTKMKIKGKGKGKGKGNNREKDKTFRNRSQGAREFRGSRTHSRARTHSFDDDSVFLRPLPRSSNNNSSSESNTSSRKRSSKKKHRREQTSGTLDRDERHGRPAATSSSDQNNKKSRFKRKHKHKQNNGSGERDRHKSSRSAKISIKEVRFRDDTQLNTSRKGRGKEKGKGKGNKKGKRSGKQEEIDFIPPPPPDDPPPRSSSTGPQVVRAINIGLVSNVNSKYNKNSNKNNKINNHNSNNNSNSNNSVSESKTPDFSDKRHDLLSFDNENNMNSQSVQGTPLGQIYENMTERTDANGLFSVSFATASSIPPPPPPDTNMNTKTNGNRSRNRNRNDNVHRGSTDRYPRSHKRSESHGSNISRVRSTTHGNGSGQSRHQNTGNTISTADISHKVHIVNIQAAPHSASARTNPGDLSLFLSDNGNLNNSTSKNGNKNGDENGNFRGDTIETMKSGLAGSRHHMRSPTVTTTIAVSALEGDPKLESKLFEDTTDDESDDYVFSSSLSSSDLDGINFEAWLQRSTTERREREKVLGDNHGKFGTKQHRSTDNVTVTVLESQSPVDVENSIKKQLMVEQKLQQEEEAQQHQQHRQQQNEMENVTGDGMNWFNYENRKHSQLKELNYRIMIDLSENGKENDLNFVHNARELIFEMISDSVDRFHGGNDKICIKTKENARNELEHVETMNGMVDLMIYKSKELNEELSQKNDLIKKLENDIRNLKKKHRELEIDNKRQKQNKLYSINIVNWKDEVDDSLFCLPVDKYKRNNSGDNDDDNDNDNEKKEKNKEKEKVKELEERLNEYSNTIGKQFNMINDLKLKLSIKDINYKDAQRQLAEELEIRTNLETSNENLTKQVISIRNKYQLLLEKAAMMDEAVLFGFKSKNDVKIRISGDSSTQSILQGMCIVFCLIAPKGDVGCGMCRLS